MRLRHLTASKNSYAIPALAEQQAQVIRDRSCASNLQVIDLTGAIAKLGTLHNCASIARSMLWLSCRGTLQRELTKERLSEDSNPKEDMAARQHAQGPISSSRGRRSVPSHDGQSRHSSGEVGGWPGILWLDDGNSSQPVLTRHVWKPSALAMAKEKMSQTFATNKSCMARQLAHSCGRAAFSSRPREQLNGQE